MTPLQLIQQLQNNANSLEKWISRLEDMTCDTCFFQRKDRPYDTCGRTNDYFCKTFGNTCGAWTSKGGL